MGNNGPEQIWMSHRQFCCFIRRRRRYTCITHAWQIFFCSRPSRENCKEHRKGRCNSQVVTVETWPRAWALSLERQDCMWDVFWRRHRERGRKWKKGYRGQFMVNCCFCSNATSRQVAGVVSTSAGRLPLPAFKILCGFRSSWQVSS